MIREAEATIGTVGPLAVLLGIIEDGSRFRLRQIGRYVFQPEQELIRIQPFRAASKLQPLQGQENMLQATISASASARALSRS